MEEVGGGLLRFAFWIAADEAYRVSQCIIVPFPFLKDEDNIKSYLSSLQIHIEEAFGMLVAGWRLLLFSPFRDALLSYQLL